MLFQLKCLKENFQYFYRLVHPYIIIKREYKYHITLVINADYVVWRYLVNQAALPFIIHDPITGNNTYYILDNKFSLTKNINTTKPNTINWKQQQQLYFTSLLLEIT